MFRTEEVVKSNDDCYFYYYSTCKKGENCLFRHCKAALGTEIVCPEWQVGKCFRPSCSYRHMECKKDRSAIPCYWENQPGGCRKPHCVFRHYKKENIDNTVSKKDNLILPVSQNDWQPEDNQNATFTRNAVLITRPTIQPDTEEESETTLLLPPAVEPLVVSFDGESDSESCTSTPVKPPVSERKVQFINGERQTEPLIIKTTNINKGSTENLDFGIKTLQQIREEKEESREEIIEDTVVETEINLSTVPEKKVSPRRKRSKRKIQLTSPPANEELDFKIKTLEEIRKERFGKSETSDSDFQEHFADAKENNENRNQKRHIIIRRDKNLPISSSETENEKINLISKSSENTNDKEIATMDKVLLKQKRIAREIYQPPKAQKNDEIRTVSPKRKKDKSESYDNICIKTLAEIREERRLKQLQETGEDDGSSNKNSPSSLYGINAASGTEETSSRKHKADMPLSAFSNKKIKLNTTKSAPFQSDLMTRVNISSSLAESDKEKPLAIKRKLPEEETVIDSVLNNNAISSSAEEKLLPSVKRHVQEEKLPLSIKNHAPVTTKKRKFDSLNMPESESRTTKSICNITREITTQASTNDADDEFDLLLDEDDDEVDLNAVDVKDDDLLLELEEMINS